jgi:hypothetical protein
MKMDNITGHWEYKEDFGSGVDEGFAQFKQEGNKIKGVLNYTETVEEDTPFKIQQRVEGVFDGVNFRIKGVGASIIDGDETIEYNLDTWEGTLNPSHQIVGHSYDEHGCFGVFVLNRL